MKAFAHIPYQSPIEKYVTLLWEVIGEKHRNEMILPNGIVEIVFNLSNPISAVLPDGKKISKAPNCFIQGFHTHVLKVKYSDKQHLFGLRLKPHAVKSLLGITPSEISNAAIDLTLIKPQFHILWHQLVEANSFEDRVNLVENHLTSITIKECHRTQMLNNLFLEDNLRPLIIDDLKIKPIHGQAFESVKALAQQVCFSTRHLNRKSQEIFGLTAEELIRYKKFVHAIELIHREQFSLSEIAYLSGFYDQAHFIHVFKSYTSMTPKRYLQSKSKLPFHLFT